MITLNDVLVSRTKQIIESNGVLIPIEFNNGLQFKPKRTFFVSGVPDKEPRGQHAHFKTKQVLICLCGELTVKLHDGYEAKQYTLESGDSIYVPNMIWDEQIYHSKETILCSLCNTHYDPQDYINDFQEFINLKKI